MDIPVSLEIKGEKILLPLLSTTELAPTMAKLKQRRMDALKESLKEVGGIDPIQQVEMLRRERAVFYNVFLLVDYAGTLEGMNEIWELSLRKQLAGTGKDAAAINAEVTRIMGLPIDVKKKEAVAVQIINPTEDGEPLNPPAAGGGALTTDASKIKVFGEGGLDDALENMAQNGSNGPP